MVIPEGVQNIGGYWFANTDIESIEIPSSVRYLGVDAFHGCQMLKRFTFSAGSNLQEIGAKCFSNSGIETITLPGALQVIGDKPFDGCDSLITIYVEGNCQVSLSEIDLPPSAGVIPIFSEGFNIAQL